MKSFMQLKKNMQVILGNPFFDFRVNIPERLHLLDQYILSSSLAFAHKVLLTQLSDLGQSDVAF